MKQTMPNWKSAVYACAALAAVIAALAVFAPGNGSAYQAGAVERVTLGEGGQLWQTLTYTRCAHAVTRRLTAPPELYGMEMEQVAALYPEWRITEFSAEKVVMHQQPDLYCPDHLVVMTDAGGRLCVYENRYGDALALVRQLDMDADALPAAVREEAQHGVGFDTAEEMEMWLENAES